MDMSSDKPMHACKISMLWNWYTVDSCFIASTWHVRSRSMFAGTCIGVFFLVFASQWLNRVCKEFDQLTLNDSIAKDYASSDSKQRRHGTYSYWLSHQWLGNPANSSFPDHVIRTLLYTCQWGVSYIIMLLFMYYNGYIIICCILGAFFGKLCFGYNEPVPDNVVSCCKE